MATRKKRAGPTKRAWSRVVEAASAYPARASLIGAALLALLGVVTRVDRLRDSDPWPIAGIERVERVEKASATKAQVAQLERAIQRAIDASNARTRQLDRRNDDSAASWCEHYRQAEAADRVALLGRPNDAALLKSSLFDADQRAHWCGQVGR